MRHVEPSMRVPWYGLEMSAASSLTARIMETWAHGQDVADALGRSRTPTPALRHVAHLGVRARSQQLPRTRAPGSRERRVRGTRGPDGESWVWGPEDGGRPGRRVRRSTSVSSSPNAGTSTTPRSTTRGRCRERMDDDRPGVRRAARFRSSPRTVREPAVRPVQHRQLLGFLRRPARRAREMLDGASPIDVLTGDYLAELTMLILWKAQQRRTPTPATRATFLTQMEDVLGTCFERGVKVVTNAGGLNPRSLADRLRGSASASAPRRSRAWWKATTSSIGSRSCRSAASVRAPRPRHRARGGRGEAGDRQRLPRRVGDRRGARRGADVVVYRSRHRRRAHRRAGRVVARLGPRRLGRARRCRRRGPRDRVRPAGHRRQLRVPRRDRRPPLPGLPDRRGRGRRHVRDHQARRAPAGSSRSAPSPRSCCTRSTRPRTSTRTWSRTSTPSRSTQDRS